MKYLPKELKTNLLALLVPAFRCLLIKAGQLTGSITCVASLCKYEQVLSHR